MLGAIMQRVFARMEYAGRAAAHIVAGTALEGTADDIHRRIADAEP